MSGGVFAYKGFFEKNFIFLINALFSTIFLEAL